jgi:hypothetical protein
MDITLERILSLIPRKPDGKFVHGAKKAFAEKIDGLNHPQIIADWEAGRNKSYNNYLYQIADKYNVSVEWLKGESDIKEKAVPAIGDDFTESDIKFMELFASAPEWKRKAAMALLMAAEEE